MTIALDQPAILPAAGVPRPAPLTYVPAVPLWFLQVVVLIIALCKLAFSAIVPPGYDDAYYWLWGQHLQWSYLDHAPMVGWGSWVSYKIFGWNAFALHFLPLVSVVLSALAMRAWARRIAPDHWQHYFWATLAVFLCSPLLMSMSSILYPDEGLIAFCFGALHFLALFLADWRMGRKHYSYLYLGAVLVGLAMLSKYNGALVAIGFFAAILFDGKLRSLLRSPHLYLAALVSALFLLPIIGWNATHDFASLKLHSSDRFASGSRGFSLDGPGRFTWQTALYFSPFLLWPLFKSLIAREVPGPGGAMVAIGRWTFLISTVLLLGLGAWIPASTQVAPHWEIVGLLPFILLAPLFIRSRWLMGINLVFGTIFSVLAVSYYVFSPLVTDALHISDAEAVRQYGQEQLARAAGFDKWMTNAAFIGAVRYNVSAKLAYGAGSDKGIVSLSPVIDQFYFWNDAAALKGKSGILLEEGPLGPRGRPDLFDSVTYLGPVTTTRFGRPLMTYQLYLGRGYRGVAPKP